MGDVATIRGKEQIGGAFKALAETHRLADQWAGFPCLGLIQLHAEYIARDAIRAEEAFFGENAERYAERRDEILARFEKLEAEMADFKAKIGGSLPPTPPASMARAAA